MIKLSIMEDAIHLATIVEHNINMMLADKYDVDSEVMLDELTDIAGFDILFTDNETKNEIMSVRINIPL